MSILGEQFFESGACIRLAHHAFADQESVVSVFLEKGNLGGRVYAAFSDSDNLRWHPASKVEAGFEAVAQLPDALALETLRQRFAGSGIVTRYYNPEIHQGAFALPQYVLHAVNKPSND